MHYRQQTEFENYRQTFLIFVWFAPIYIFNSGSRKNRNNSDMNKLQLYVKFSKKNDNKIKRRSITSWHDISSIFDDMSAYQNVYIY